MHQDPSGDYVSYDDYRSSGAGRLDQLEEIKRNELLARIADLTELNRKLMERII